MQYLSWFFAGASLGVFVGVFVSCLAHLGGDAKQRPFTEENVSSRPRLVLVRR